MKGKGSAAYKIDIQGLKFKDHEFNFEADSAFFQSFENSPIEKGQVTCDMLLTKTETMIQVKMELKGTVGLVCDRTLRPFDHELTSKNQVTFKFSDTWEELDVDLYQIPRTLDQLDVSGLLYEYCVLALPMKRIHPDIEDSEEEEDDWVFSTDAEADEETTQELDPRWEKLKNLKNKN